MKPANKIVLNTGILYGRMIVTMGITFYSTRLILQALGSSDFGIFSLIAGVIAMLSFLNSAMSTATQRFLSFYQGQNDRKKQITIFQHSLVLHFVIGVFIVLVLELLGLFLFKGFLNIPVEKINDAKIIYHLMSFTVLFSIVSVPFVGLLTAHENMLVVAINNIFQSVGRLGIAFLLLNIDNNKLIVYGILMESISIASLILYGVYCFNNYGECKLKGIFKIDFLIIKELSSFAGWNLFGVLCGLGLTQGLSIILNIFFGTIINAAYGIANQVLYQLNFLSATLLRAINPQIMKSEGLNDRNRMLRLSMIASKFCFFLLAIIAVPAMFEINPLLSLWLKDVPPNTVSFCCLFLVGTLINQLTIGLQSAIQATGRIKLYQTVVGSTLLLNLPISYFLLSLGQPPYSVLISYSCIELVGVVLRIYFLRRFAGLSVTEYIEKVFYKEIIPVSILIISCYCVTHFFQFRFRFLFTGLLSGILFIISIYFTGLCADEKAKIQEMAKSFYVNKIKLILK